MCLPLGRFSFLRGWCIDVAFHALEMYVDDQDACEQAMSSYEMHLVHVQTLGAELLLEHPLAVHGGMEI